MTTKVHWHPSVNVGDYLAKWMFERITGKNPEYVEANCGQPHYQITGSILNASNENTIVWGTGVANVDDKIPMAKEWCAVRGHGTKKKIVTKYGIRYDNIAVGDPVLLMPKFYSPDIEKKYDLGVVPHWMDYYKAMLHYRDEPNVKVINVLLAPEEVIDWMLQCDKIVSSSLHGLILSHAYGLPARWCEFSDKVIGKGFKFRDYFTSVGIQNYAPFDMRRQKTISEIIKSVPGHKIDFDHESLWGACPFKL